MTQEVPARSSGLSVPLASHSRFSLSLFLSPLLCLSLSSLSRLSLDSLSPLSLFLRSPYLPPSLSSLFNHLSSTPSRIPRTMLTPVGWLRDRLEQLVNAAERNKKQPVPP